MFETNQERIWQLNSVRSCPRGNAPIVLIHPVGLDLTYWQPQFSALSQTYDVVAFDLPGHGSSPGTPQDWTLPQAMSFIEQVVNDTGCAKAQLVGLSVGGILAQAFALARPERVKSLALLSTAPCFSDEARAAMRKRAANAREGGMQAVLQECLKRWFSPATLACRPDLIDRVKKTLLADDPAIHAALWDMIAGFGVVEQLGRINVPTLIVTGELDSSSPPSSAELLHRGIAGSILHIVPACSHMVPQESPDLVNSYLLDFFAELEGSKG